MLPSSLSAMIRQSSGCFSASLRIADLYRPCENDKVALVPLVINSITFSLHPSMKISFSFCSIIIIVLFFGVHSGFVLTHFTLLGAPKSPNIFARVIVSLNSFACVIASTNPHAPDIFCLKIHQFVIIFNIIRQSLKKKILRHSSQCSNNFRSLFTLQHGCYFWIFFCALGIP